jgi:hypothetical protein
MTYPASLLPDLLVGWQKIADRYNMPIYISQTGAAYHAVSNETQGVGQLVETLAPRGLAPDRSAKSGSGTVCAQSPKQAHREVLADGDARSS